MNDNIPSFILIHCSAYPADPGADRLGAINTLHKARGFDQSSLGFYVGYHVLLTGGKAHRCRQDLEHGDHCNNENLVGQPGYLFSDHQSLNFHSVAVCVDFDGDDGPIPGWAIPLLVAQVKEWMDKYDIPLERVMFHRDFDVVKTCPGSTITKDYIRSLFAPAPAPIPTPAPTPPVQDLPAIQQRITLLQQLVALLEELLQLRRSHGLTSSMNDTNTNNDTSVDITGLPWYQSSAGPGISATLMFLAGELLPVLKDLFGFTIGTSTVDHIINFVVVIFFAAGAGIAYLRSKRTLQAKVQTLRGQVRLSGSHPAA